MIPVVLFGSASAPHSATRVLNQLADDEKMNFPLASQTIKRDCYVDDILTGTNTVKQAIKLRDELIGLTKAGGFTLRKWIFNDLNVVKSLPDSLTNVNLLNENNSEMKALGVQWDSITDVITYKVIENFNEKITKRTILSNIARLYDPIGLLGPVIVAAKLIMQLLWQSQTDWDESVPQYIHTAWFNLKNRLPALNEIKFPRKVVIKESVRIEIHGFCDASEKAYGGCIYFRSIDKDGKILTALLCSKNRVAPLKTISLPKLELCAALLLARLIQTVLDATTLEFNDIVLWSDSSITLQWISMHPHKLKTFVAKRASEIREITSTMHWRHVPTQDNPADILSRGLSPVDLIKNDTWQTGPTWLKGDESKWPKNVIQTVPIPEVRSTQVIHIATRKIDLLTKYSSIGRLKRVIAYILRFKYNAFNRKTRITGPITIAELNRALNTIIILTQRETFSNDVKQLAKTNRVDSHSQLRALNPFLDKKGLIRVGGRLEHSSLPFSEKHPLVLPKNHHVTELIIQNVHIVNLHSGTQATLHAVRAKYWPLNGKNETKKVIKNCMTCFKANPADCSYFMGDLPANRVTQSRPFLNTGLDYCGPFYVKEKRFRNRGKVKIYACIFVCFTTRAVHIELISDLTTEAFIAGLRRFFARRGLSTNLYSDNATNFVGARNEIEQIAKLVQSQSHNDLVKSYLTSKGITWHFTPPRSPHFGGLWEAAVKSFKFHYYRVVGEKLFTYEELNTYTCKIEAILNSRPITPMSQDPNDLRALTLAHFLIGEALPSLPEVDYTDTPVNRLSVWEHIQFMKQHFWRRWSKEYLNQLTTRAKWHLKKPEDIKIGSLVLLKEDNISSLRWPLGRIVEVFPGKDGTTRVVTVKTSSGSYKRSITRVAPLPVD